MVSWGKSNYEWIFWGTPISGNSHMATESQSPTVVGRDFFHPSPWSVAVEVQPMEALQSPLWNIGRGQKLSYTSMVQYSIWTHIYLIMFYVYLYISIYILYAIQCYTYIYILYIYIIYIIHIYIYIIYILYIYYTYIYILHIYYRYIYVIYTWDS